MSEFESTGLNVPMLVAAGCGVSELRKLNVSPADIRKAGFTFDQMSVHLGVARLIEAGFSLADFQSTNTFSLRDLASHYPLNALMQTNKYSLAELFSYFSPTELREAGFSATDFVQQAGCTSSAVLKQYGFSDTEITAAGLTIPPVAAAPRSFQPPNASTMAVGDSWHTRREGDASTFLNVTFTRLDSETARVLLRRPHSDNNRPSNYKYDGSGKNCPRCGRVFVLLDKYTSSDGMCGVESGTWVCDDAKCGMKKEERYEGYNSIF